MLTLEASSVSSGALKALALHPDPGVLGIHDRSLDLLCGDDVLSLAGTDAGNLPRGLLVDLPEGMTWKSLRLLQGARVRAGGGYLFLSPDVVVNLTLASLWQSRRHLSSHTSSPERVRRAVRIVARGLVGAEGLGAAGAEIESLAAGLEPTVPEEPFFYPTAVRHLAAVMRHLNESDPMGLVDGATGLVGLGIGLTPSGDDVLTGLIGSLVLLAGRVPALGWIGAAAGALVARSRGRTNPVSLTYLRCAANGEIGEMHERLLQALVAGDSTSSEATCQSLRRFGHSSGGEIALGTLLAVDAAVRNDWMVPA